MEDYQFLHQNFDSSLSSESKTTISPWGTFKALLVEDDPTLGPVIKKYLGQKLGLDIHHFDNINDCLQFITQVGIETPFCLITDIGLEKGGDGLLLIDILKERGANFFSIVITGFASIETAILATKKGAYHYLTKPFELENLKCLLEEGAREKFNIGLLDISKQIPLQVETSKPEPKGKILKRSLKIETPTKEDMFFGIVGRSYKMKEVFDSVRKVAFSDSTVLISGPSGTGKELVAQAIYKLSTRSKANFVSVNCGAIPGELLESELFGHVKGSFTGAISDRKGRFELANSGVIFLDEIGDMPLVLQVKLLRVLQNREIEPLGSGVQQKVDVRVITATHRDLETMVSKGSFREDLYYRLNVIPIKVPPLKDRREDIPLLISYFLSRFVSADGRNAVDFTEEALELMLSYDWPGNVRELENLIERLVILRGGHVIGPEDLPAKIYTHTPSQVPKYKHSFELPMEGLDLRQVLSEIEDSLIQQALKRTNGNKNQASRLLQLNRTTLIEKLRKKDLIF